MPATKNYQSPRKTVLLIGCIDLRFADNVTAFMDRENLTNRYDQFILAGAALGGVLEEAADELHDNIVVEGKNLGAPKQFFDWQKTLLHHLELAILLHDIHDVYIVEHEDCGAYKAFLKDGDYSKDSDSKREHKAHEKHARRLAKLIQAYAEKNHPDHYVNVHTFIMDLKGEVHPMKKFLA